MTEARGLAAGTRRHGTFEMRSLLRWLHANQKSVATVSVADLDAYIGERVVRMLWRRRTRAQLASTLRGVLRYLHDSGKLANGMAHAIEAPAIYAFEDIPSTIRREDVDRALHAARCDRTPPGRRNYARQLGTGNPEPRTTAPGRQRHFDPLTS